MLIPYSVVQPFYNFDGVLRIPYHWEDDTNWHYKKSFTFESNLNEQLSVFDFHPIHTYINTFSQDFYNENKTNYHNWKNLLKARNAKYTGARDILIRTLKYVKKMKLKNYKLAEIAKVCLTNKS